MPPKVLPPAYLVPVVLALAACTSVRLDQTTPPPNPPRSVDVERYPPPKLRAPPTQPIEAAPVPSTPAASAEAVTLPPPDVASPLPLPAPAAPTSTDAAPSASATALASPGAADAGAAPAPRPTSAASAAATARANEPTGLAPGRWSVQAGVFLVAPNAQGLRARLEQRLAGSGLPASDRSLRIAQRDGRHHVVIGDRPDRAGASQLAAKLREILQQDVSLFAW